MKLACSSMLAAGDTLREKMAYLRRFGFEGVELRILETEATPQYMDELESALVATGLQAACVIVPSKAYMAVLDSEEVKQAKIANAKIALEVGARLGAAVMITPEYQPQSPLPLWNPPKPVSPQERELLMSFLGEVADHAEKVSAVAVLEPINRYETHFYHRLEQVMAVCDAVGSPRVKIVADFFHMQIEERDIAESIKRAAGYIYHVQLGDSNRFLPGQGHTDFRRGFAALKQIGYDRFMALECRVQGDPEQDLPACVQHLRRFISDAAAI